MLAATLFGISTPLVQRAGSGVGPFSTAALLYAGAALAGALTRRPVEREAALRAIDLRRVALMALFGAAIGPVALAWGLQRTSATSASLMLTLEALFTVVLAHVLYRERMDRRVWLAMLLLLAGGAVLVGDEARSAERGSSVCWRCWLRQRRGASTTRCRGPSRSATRVRWCWPRPRWVRC